MLETLQYTLLTVKNVEQHCNYKTITYYFLGVQLIMNQNTDDAVAIEVNHKELEGLFDHYYHAGKPLMLWGTFGIGKSDTVSKKAQQLAEKEDGRELAEWNELSREEKQQVMENPEDHFIFMDIRLAEFDPTDIKGIPDLEGDGAVEWKPPKWVEVISQPEAKGVVFLDECNLAPTSVQSAFYQLVLDRQVGEYSVSDGIYLLGAGNRASDQANTYQMAAPLRNRFTHLQLQKPTAGEQGSWISWAMDNGVSEKVIGYLASPTGNEHLFRFGEENREAKAIPTPRQWEYVSDLIQGIELPSNNDSLRKRNMEKIKKLSASCVGEGVAKEFVAFLKLREQVDIDEIIEKPEEVKQIQGKGDVDLKYSVLTGIAAEYKQDKDKLENLVEIASHLDEEFGTLMLRLAKQYHPRHFENNIVEIPQFEELSKHYEKYLL